MISGNPAQFTRRSTTISGGIALAIGAYWLQVWLTGGGAHRAAAGILSPKTNMAVGQLAAGLALILAGRRPGRGWQRSAATLLAVLVLALGAATLCEHVFGVDFGIDELL